MSYHLCYSANGVERRESFGSTGDACQRADSLLRQGFSGDFVLENDAGLLVFDGPQIEDFCVRFLRR